MQKSHYIGFMEFKEKNSSHLNILVTRIAIKVTIYTLNTKKILGPNVVAAEFHSTFNSHHFSKHSSKWKWKAHFQTQPMTLSIIWKTKSDTDTVK